jgi:hypothetical protein
MERRPSAVSALNFAWAGEKTGYIGEASASALTAGAPPAITIQKVPWNQSFANGFAVFTEEM